MCVLDFIWDCDWYLSSVWSWKKKLTCMFDFSWNNRARACGERERETRQRQFKPVELRTRAHACHRRCKMFLEKNGGKREKKKKKNKGEIGNNCASSVWELELMTTVQCFETHHGMAGWYKNSSTWILDPAGFKKKLYDLMTQFMVW